MTALTICSTLLAAPAIADEVQLCFLFCTVKRSPAVDSFCNSYQLVNQNSVDSAELKKLSRGPKVRLTANDALYLCKCKGWDNPICEDAEAKK